MSVVMSVVVTARTATREISFRRGSLLAALEQALMLAASGMEGVRIVDGQGRSHAPADLSRLLLGGRTPAVGSLAA